jgi:hypothetical protein
MSAFQLSSNLFLLAVPKLINLIGLGSVTGSLDFFFGVLE